MAGNNGIQLPISLQISNLQDVANQIKQFANKNVLADSLGGKKIDSELGKILNRLEQISAKAKTAFTTQADFTSVQKEISQVELSLNKVQGTIKNLGFDELKIPEEFSGQIAALQGRIRELNSSLATFKGTQKEKLVSNVDFMADLQKADPKQAAKWLEKGYDELQKAINDGMTRVNTTLALKAAEYQDKQKIITQNSTGKVVSTQLGALSFIQEAFKSLPKDDKARNTAQAQMADFMKATVDESGKAMEFTGFKQGARGLNDFLKYIADSYSFTPEQLTQIRTRLRQQVQELAKEGQKITQTDVIKSMSHDEGLAKKILFGDNANELELAAKKYANDMRDAQRILEEQTKLQGQSDAFVRLKVAFDVPNQEIQQKAAEIAAALKVPTEALQGFEAQILSAATASPQLAALFQKAAGEISTLNNAVEEGKQRLQSIDSAIGKMQGISNFVNRYVGLYAIVRKVTQAVRDAMSNIKDIDKAITSIAVVTNMTQADLWGKIGEYTQMAQQYGVATKEVYTVSQIFYQQGLQTAQVMSLTTETLKMAKIAGIDYSTAANAMTVAVRAFKLEMTEAQSVTDTYSALAAKFAVSSAEIANAMEKTASSAASVGMSLQSTSAFISVMEQTTRESAQNIGSALKSIISRYGEMKASPEKLLNVEGEEVAFNKVDTALKSVGISIKDASGQFRDFDDVIMELAQKWNSLDNNTQRYIATIMAGNRQQSRFIALVSNYDELSRAMDVANNAENASIVQVAKTMDSLETKAQQVKNAFSQIYLDLHAEEGLKSMYDWLTQILKTIGKLGTLKGVLPTLMNIIGVGTGVKKLTSIGMQALQDKKSKLQIETDEAKQKIEEIRTKASEDIRTKWKIEADLSQLTAQKSMLQAELSVATTQRDMLGTKAYQAYQSAGGSRTEEQFRAAIASGNNLKSELVLAGKSPQDQQAATNAIQVYSDAANRVEELSSSITRLDTAINGLTASKENEQAVTDQVVQSKQQETTTEQVKASAAVQAAQEDLNKAVQARETAREDMNRAQKAADAAQAEADHATKLKLWDAETLQNKAATKAGDAEAAKQAFEKAQADAAGARAALTKAQADEEGAQTEHDESNANRESAETERQKKDTGLSLTNWGTGNALKYASIGTGIARLVGTAITAAGAAHQDKSTDNVETSKIMTGVGNGLSMAGTGASMLMSLGPWGAAVGAIGGFLLGGLGAIIDGATMTLSERIALKKEEAQKAADESLKIQAKATDMSGQIDNLKQLQKTMYNSTEDMQAYKDAMNTMASQYPELVSAYDSAGNAIVEITDAEAALSQARLQGAAAAREAAIKNLDVVNTQLKAWKQNQVSGTVHAERQAYLDIITDDTTTNEEKIANIRGLENTYGPWFAGLANSLESFSGVDISKELPSDVKQAFVEPLKGWFTTYSEQLNLDSIDKVALRGNKDDKWTIEQLQRVLTYVEGQEKKLQEKAKNLNDIANSSTGFETLLTYLDLDTTVQQSSKSQLETTKNYQGFFNELLTNKLAEKNETLAPEEQFMNLYDWKSAENSDYTEFTNDVYQSFLEWYNSLSESLKNEFASMDFTEYKNADELIQHFNIGSDLAEEFTEQFTKANIANRNRILKTIYSADENGEYYADELNPALTGLQKLESQRVVSTSFNAETEEFEEEIESYNKATDIANKFGILDHNGEVIEGTQEIISKYADYFTSQLISINDLANDGYVKLAATRLDVLSNLTGALSEMTSDQQQDIFGIVTSIDFGSYDSIQTAIQNINEYAKNNEIDIASDSAFKTFYSALEDAASNLLFNVTTLAQEVTATITNAANNIDSILSTNKSGLSFDKALEDYASLSAKFSDLGEFDKVFSYDAVLGKYVYTQQGLTKAIQAQEQKLNEQVTQLTETAALYANTIASDVEFKLAHFEQGEFTEEDDLKQALSITTKDKKLNEAYEKLAKEYMDSLEKYEDASSDGFVDFIMEQVANAEKASNEALIILNEYNKNKKNQYYQAIDWSKLALGTDFSGTNQQMLESLAAETSKYGEDAKDEAGKVIGRQLNGIAFTWNEVLDEYLNETYGENTDAKKIAETAIKGQIKQQKSQSISTAITELLQGAGSAVSEGTAAILQEQGKLNLLDKDGLLRSAGDFVQSALDLFNSLKDTYTTVAERNKAYLEVIQAGFKKAQGFQTMASSGGQLDLNSIGSVFDAFGLNLDEYYNQATNTWNSQIKVFDENSKYVANKPGFANIFETDMFGNTTIKDWDAMMRTIPQNMKEKFVPGNDYYDEWYNAYVQGQLDRKNKKKTRESTAMSNLMNAKEGESISIANLPSNLKTKLQENFGFTGDKFENISEVARDNFIMSLDAASEEFDEQTQRWIADSQKSIRSKRGSKGGAFESVIKEKVSESEARAFSMAWKGTENDWNTLMTELGFVWDENAQMFLSQGNTTIESIDAYLGAHAKELTQEAINGLLALKKNLKDTQTNKPDNAIRDLLSNYTNVTNEMIGAFETQFPTIDVDQYVTEINGKKVLDVAALRAALMAAGVKVDEAFAEAMGQIIDDRLAYISSATDLVASGTTSQTDMASFVEKYNQTMGTTLKQGDLFGYDEILKAFTLKPEYIAAYIERQKQELLKLGWNVQDIDQYIEDTTINQFKAATDISSFLSSENRKKGGQAYKSLYNSMRATQYASLESEDAASYLEDLSKIPSEFGKTEAKRSAQRAANEAKARNDKKRELIDKEVEDDLSSLEAGGLLAINVMKKYSETGELTAEEVEAAYKMKFNNLLNAMDALEGIQINTVVDATTRDILNGIKGFSVSADGVVLAVGNMVTAYEEIYKQMSNSAGHTTSELNSAYARVMTAQDQGNIDALDALKNASGMTYDALGQLLGKYNIKLEEFMQQENNGVERDNFGNVKVISWNDFMKAAGLSELDMSDPQVMEAYSSWVDSRVEFENKEKQRVEDAVDELKGLTEVKPGDAINVAHLESVMGDSLAKIATQYGAQLNEGLLKLGNTTNIPGLITAIADEAAAAGAMLPGQLAELADAVAGMLDQITSLIQGGIKGSLNNTDANKLQEWATQSGLGKLDFTKTADGLRLSEASAIALYKALKDTDKLQASLVFDDLRESLEATRDEYKDTQSLIEHVNKIRNGTYEADNTISTARKKQYQEELEIAEQILAVRATSEDSSFKFMDKSIPAGQNNPLNYMESWAKAFSAMKATKSGGKDSKGLMEYTDFYNIITEMGNIAQLSGQAITLGKKTVSNAEEAANLITEAAGKLKVTADGKMKVDLSGIGVDFQMGAEGMAKGVDAGVDAVADAQIEMLDSIIRVLEVVVAMEQLGDLDVSGDNIIDLDEVFTLQYDSEGNAEKIKGFTTEYQDFRKKIKDAITKGGANYNEDLARAMKSVRINGETLSSLFNLDEAAWKKKSVEEARAFTDTLSALYKAALSDNFDLDDITNSVYKVLQESGLDDMSIDVGKKTFYIHGGVTSVIDWSNKEIVASAEKAFDEYISSHEKLFKDIGVGKNSSIKKKVDAIQKLLSEGKITGTSKKDIEWQMSLLTGEVTITEDKKAKNAWERFNGSYKGQTFKGATEKQVHDAIQRAMDLESQGYSFSVVNGKKSINVKGKKKIGNATITLVKTKKGDVYKVLGKTFKKENDALAYAASKGYADSSQEGQTYTYEGKEYTVQYDSALGIAYSINTTTGKILYNGHEFGSQEALMKYVKEYLPLLKGSGWKTTKQKELGTGNEIIVSTKGKISIEENLGTGEITYYHDGQAFASGEDYAEYMLAQEHAKADKNSITSKDGKTITYTVSGHKVTAKINADGTVTYTVKLDGDVYTSSTEEGIKQAIADRDYLKGGEAKKKKSDGKKKGPSYTVKKGGVKITVTYDESGVKVKSSDGSDTTTMEKKLNEKFQEEVDETSPTAKVDDLTVEVSDLKVALAKNATVTFDAGTNEDGSGKSLTVTSEIPSAEGTVSAVDLSLATGATVTLSTGSDEAGNANTLTASNAIPNVEAKASAVNVKTVEGATVDVELPENITHDEEVPVKATDVKISADAVDATSIGEQIAESIQQALNEHKVHPVVESGNTGGDNTGSSTGASVEMPDFSTAISNITTIASTIENIKSEGVTNVKDAADKISSTNIDAVKKAADNIDSTKAESAKSAINNIDPSKAESAKSALNNITAHINASSASASATISVSAGAAGNIGALAKGNMALAGGTRTLVGELGPELVVSNGRYFIVGQNGAEFVDLEKDAIVFNHKQTERLLNQGGIGSRGVPFTNEDNAISYAKGNIEGPAYEGGTLKSLTTRSGRNVHKVGANAFQWDVAEISIGSKPGGCFVAGTKVTLADGTKKNIEDMAIGDEVIAYNDTTKKFEVRKVNKAMPHHNTPRVLEITFSNGTTLGITPGHPILTTDGWKSRDIENSLYEHNTIATWLEVGDEVIGYEGNAFVTGINELDIPNNYTTYNVEVETCHTFMVDGLVVHNAKAAADAKGTIGPAMASASAALNALKQLRAMWKSLKSASAQDLAGLGGGGGGGGGGDKDGTFLKNLERWYNWLQEIAKQEEKINYQEKLRAKLASDNIKNGKAYYQSQKKSLESLQSELATTRSLVTAQQNYFNNRREELNTQNGPFSSLYTFDSEGQLKYGKNRKNYTFVKNTKNGKQTTTKSMTGLEFLSELSGRNEAGAAKYTVQEQYEALVKAGFKEYMKYDTNGKIIEYNKDKKGNKTTPKDNAAYEAAVQAFWDKIDQDKEEMQSLHDSINEYSEKELELQQAQNDLLQEMQDNQMELEQELLDAVVNKAEKIIKEQQDLRDAYSDASQKMIQGLNDALSKEREKYAKNQEDAELLQLRRRLALLQRSGASSSEIASLQQEIQSRSQDAYFSEQERQINAIQEAADQQIERLDTQIDIQTKTLEYQKEHGLLWAEVADIMAKSPEEITDYLVSHSPDFMSGSALTKSETADDWFFKASQWEQFRQDLANGDSTITSIAQRGTVASDADMKDFDSTMENTFGDSWKNMDKAQKAGFENKFKERYAETGDFQGSVNEMVQEVDRTIKWPGLNDSYSKKFGKNWTAQLAEKAKSAYMSGGDTAMQTVLAKEKIWTTTKNKNGTYSVVASTDPKGATTKASAQQKANRINDLNAFIKSYKTLTKSLTSKQLETLKTTFNKAYNNNYSSGRSKAKQAAIDAAKAYKPFKTLLNKKKWAIYQKTDGSWAVKEVKDKNALKSGKTPKSNKTITTYDQATKVAAENNAKWKTWVKNKKKGAEPKYNVKYQYDEGGMVEQTGTALLHAKESVLTSQQTDILRNEILGRSKNSLMNLLLDFKNAYNNIGNAGVTSAPSIIIENASVNMNVASIANDYDAKRAGEQALSEMLKIARKKGAASALRR